MIEGRRGSNSSSRRIAADREEGSSDGSGGGGGSGGSGGSGGTGSGSSERRQLPPRPPRLCLRGGGPLVAAAVAALGSVWGLAAAAFLVSAAASPSWLPEAPGGAAPGATRSPPSPLVAALPLPRGLPARGISLLAAAGCFAAAVTTTHGVGGRATAGAAAAAGPAAAAPRPFSSSSSPPSSAPSSIRRRFRFWQPFRGGGAFIATQAIGWSLTGLATLGFLKVSAAVLASAARTSASAAAAVVASAALSSSLSLPLSPSPSPSTLLFDVLLTAALMPVAQAVLAVSVSLWDASSPSSPEAAAPPRRGSRTRMRQEKGGGGAGAEEDVEEKQQLFEKAAARSRSHPNSLPPLSTWPIIVLIYAPAHITISLIVAVLAGAGPVLGGLSLISALAVYYAVTERGDPARTGRRRWPRVANALARVAEPALAAWHGGLEVVHDALEDDDEWEAFCSRAEEDVRRLLSGPAPRPPSPSPAPSPSAAAAAASEEEEARALVRAPLSGTEPAVLGVAPHGLFPASLLYLGRLAAFRAGGACWPRGRDAPTPAVASAVMRVPVLRDLASIMGARAVTRSAIADALRVREREREEEGEEGAEERRQRRRGSNSGGGRKQRVGGGGNGAPYPPAPAPSAPSVALVPGGQSELIHTWRLHARRELVLVRRHAGFVRVALSHNAALVPVLVLGEAASLADAISLPKLKAKSIKALGFPVPFLVSGRFFPGSPLPRGGTPLRFVVGPAIRVARASRDEEREEAVAEAHERYFKAIERLFARHASAAGHGDVRLVWADEGPERKMVGRRRGEVEDEVEVEAEGAAAAFVAADASVTVSASLSGKEKAE